MSVRPAGEIPSTDALPPASALRNLAFVVLVLAALGVVGQGVPTGKEIFRNLGGGGAAWVVCGLLTILGVAVVWTALAQFQARLTGRSGFAPSSKTELVMMFTVVILAGAVGGALGRNLDWRLEWTSGKYLEGSSQVWPEVQGWVGWLLSVSLVVSIWALSVQVRADRRRSTPTSHG